jgi:hypothetical protein
VVADLTGGDPGEGIRTENRVMSLLATEYVKEEIMSMTLMDELGEERYWALCKIPRS